MEVRIRHGKGQQSEAFARFHRVVCDQPFNEGGSDTGMTPPELMLSALGCCAMHYATQYLRTRHLPFDSTELRISAVKGGQPARLTEIGIEVDVPALSARARNGLMKAIDACLLKRTLADPPKLTVTLVPLAIESPSNTQPVSLAP
jgi:putative redox protein